VRGASVGLEFKQPGVKKNKKDIPLFDREADFGTAILGGQAFDW
jgi:hypothetical protein